MCLASDSWRRRSTFSIGVDLAPVQLCEWARSPYRIGEYSSSNGVPEAAVLRRRRIRAAFRTVLRMSPFFSVNLHSNAATTPPAKYSFLPNSAFGYDGDNTSTSTWGPHSPSVFMIRPLVTT